MTRTVFAIAAALLIIAVALTQIAMRDDGAPGIIAERAGELTRQ